MEITEKYTSQTVTSTSPNQEGGGYQLKVKVSPILHRSVGEEVKRKRGSNNIRTDFRHQVQRLGGDSNSNKLTQ